MGYVAVPSQPTAEDYRRALEDLTDQCFRIAMEEQIAVNAQPAFHIAMDYAERLLRRSPTETSER
jgi:hypothetical protein